MLRAYMNEVLAARSAGGESSVQGGSLGTMGSEPERVAYLNVNASSELLFLWNESEVPILQQYQMTVAGFKNIRKFVSLDDTKVAVRAAVSADLTLDPTARAGDRLIIATIVAAWEIAKEQLGREIQLRAEAKTLNIARPMGNSERTGMKRVLEEQYGKLAASETPSAEYLSSKLEEVENNEPSASRLDEVTCMEDSESLSVMQTTVDSTGRLQVVNRKSKVSMPATPEELRMRLRIEMNLWLMISARFTNKSWLRGLNPTHWSKWVDHFLGKRCNDMTIPLGVAASDGSTHHAVKPPWGIVLSYEYECRKHSFARVRDEGISIGEAMTAALRDSELKETFFTSPIALLGSRSTGKGKPPGGEGTDPPRLTKAQRRAAAQAAKGRGKGKGDRKGGKGDRKGGKAGGKGDLVSVTPDGRQICYAYSNQAEGCRGECGRVHICRKRGCGGDHPTFEHA